MSEPTSVDELVSAVVDALTLPEAERGHRTQYEALMVRRAAYVRGALDFEIDGVTVDSFVDVLVDALRHVDEDVPVNYPTYDERQAARA